MPGQGLRSSLWPCRPRSCWGQPGGCQAVGCKWGEPWGPTHTPLHPHSALPPPRKGQPVMAAEEDFSHCQRLVKHSWTRQCLQKPGEMHITPPVPKPRRGEQIRDTRPQGLHSLGCSRTTGKGQLCGALAQPGEARTSPALDCSGGRATATHGRAAWGFAVNEGSPLACSPMMLLFSGTE